MDKSSECPADDPDLAVSAKIRNRLRLAKQRFHANDNISSFIEPGELDRLLEEVTVKMKGCAGKFSRRHRERSQYTQLCAPCRQDVSGGSVSGAIFAASACYRIPKHREPERINDRRPCYGAKRVQSPSLPHHGPALDRLDAQPALESDRLVEICTTGRMDHDPPANSGRSHHSDGRPSYGCGQARRVGDCPGGRSFLYALARS